MLNMTHTCFYYTYKCHTTNACYIRNFGVPNGNYVWVDKRVNQKGPKEYWVPRKYYYVFL